MDGPVSEVSRTARARMWQQGLHEAICAANLCTFKTDEHDDHVLFGPTGPGVQRDKQAMAFLAPIDSSLLADGRIAICWMTGLSRLERGEGEMGVKVMRREA